MKLIHLKCPSCNASLSVEKNRKILFCEYCGAKVLLDDENIKKEITKNINFTKKNISVDETKIEEMKHERAEIKGFIIFFVVIFLGLMGLIFLNEYGQQIEDYFVFHNVDESDIIIMPGSSSSYEFKNVKVVKKELTDAGFTDITLVKDSFDSSISNLLGRNGEVIEVEINGRKVLAGKKYNKNSEIIIHYYSQ